MDKLRNTIKELVAVTSADKVAARIGEIIMARAKASLRDERNAFNGVKWKPLNPDYAKRKKKKYGKRRMLDRDHNLKKILNRKTGVGERVIGTTAKSAKGYPYPAVHQFGSDNGLIPARPFLPFDRDLDLAPSVAKKIDEGLQGTLKEVLEGKK
jgi:phage gpG-like protein